MTHVPPLRRLSIRSGEREKIERKLKRGIVVEAVTLPWAVDGNDATHSLPEAVTQSMSRYTWEGMAPED